ncbi:MAG: hypothetical protein IPJ65_14815 [Archangiaceae bacterium]|nr:hypothetical protein [Archangiaceae bacterium]
MSFLSLADEIATKFSKVALPMLSTTPSGPAGMIGLIALPVSWPVMMRVALTVTLPLVVVVTSEQFFDASLPSPESMTQSVTVYVSVPMPPTVPVVIGLPSTAWLAKPQLVSVLTSVAMAATSRMVRRETAAPTRPGTHCAQPVMTMKVTSVTMLRIEAFRLCAIEPPHRIVGRVPRVRGAALPVARGRRGVKPGLLGVVAGRFRLPVQGPGDGLGPSVQ